MSDRQPPGLRPKQRKKRLPAYLAGDVFHAARRPRSQSSDRAYPGYAAALRICFAPGPRSRAPDLAEVEGHEKHGISCVRNVLVPPRDSSPARR